MDGGAAREIKAKGVPCGDASCLVLGLGGGARLSLVGDWLLD